MKKILKKGIIGMRSTWSIEKKKFRNYFKGKIMLFNYTLKSNLTYGTETWGWTEMQQIEKLEKKYLKWV